MACPQPEGHATQIVTPTLFVISTMTDTIHIHGNSHQSQIIDDTGEPSVSA